MTAPQKPTYNCAKCPGFCCSYDVIGITKRDVERLAGHFGMSFENARLKFTKADGGEQFALRRKADEHFGRICTFFDTDKRRCTIYEARPSTCRSYPGHRCGYYEFLKFERTHQGDPKWVATTQNK
jgi:uncharacterized protein